MRSTHDPIQGQPGVGPAQEGSDREGEPEGCTGAACLEVDVVRQLLRPTRGGFSQSQEEHWVLGVSRPEFLS